MENNTKPENEQVQPEEIKMIEADNVVPVDKAELQALIDENLIQKEELGALVGLFLNFRPLFKGDVNPISLVSLIPKLLSDPKIKTEVGAILPIIEKYSA
ncbi:hypothetical protein ACFSR6_03375 [Pedobacter vanadiisoli]|uniref:Uncharacterized protein n=1 Tax=Pedobacter vanadiisoli TaxID=1761975 RepID=A0ABW5ME99_9SPHI